MPNSALLELARSTNSSNIAESWKVNVCTELSQYIHSLENSKRAIEDEDNSNLQLSEQSTGDSNALAVTGGGNRMNFNEIALVLHHSTTVYSRQVDYLQLITHQTVTSLNSRQNSSLSDKSKTTSRLVVRAIRNHTSSSEAFMDWETIDSIPESSSNILYYPFHKWNQLQGISMPPLANETDLGSCLRYDDEPNSSSCPATLAESLYLNDPYRETCKLQLANHQLNQARMRSLELQNVPHQCRSVVTKIPEIILTNSNAKSINDICSGLGVTSKADSTTGASSTPSSLVLDMIRSFQQLKLMSPVDVSTGMCTLRKSENFIRNLTQEYTTDQAKGGVPHVSAAVGGGTGPPGSSLPIHLISGRRSTTYGEQALISPTISANMMSVPMSSRLSVNNGAVVCPEKKNRALGCGALKLKCAMKSAATLLGKVEGRQTFHYLDPHCPGRRRVDKPLKTDRDIWRMPAESFGWTLQTLLSETCVDSGAMGLFPFVCPSDFIRLGPYFQKSFPFCREKNGCLYYQETRMNNNRLSPPGYWEFENIIRQRLTSNSKGSHHSSPESVSTNKDNGGYNDQDYDDGSYVNDDEGDGWMGDDPAHHQSRKTIHQLESTIDSISQLLTATADRATLSAVPPQGDISSVLHSVPSSCCVDPEELMNKRVAQWRVQVASWMKQQPPVFKVGDYKDILKQRLSATGTLRFSQLTEHSDKIDKCRLFLTVLFMANKGSVCIECPSPSSGEDFMVSMSEKPLRESLPGGSSTE